MPPCNYSVYFRKFSTNIHRIIDKNCFLRYKRRRYAIKRNIMGHGSGYSDISLIMFLLCALMDKQLPRV